jgi:hypothetical protein
MEMTKIGTFTIEESFNITNRGIVILGHSPDTIIKLGQYVTLNIKGTTTAYKIIGTEIGQKFDTEYLKIGLLLSIADQTLVDYITQNKIINKTVDILTLA